MDISLTLEQSMENRKHLRRDRPRSIITTLANVASGASADTGEVASRFDSILSEPRPTTPSIASGSITQAAPNGHSISRFLQAIRDIVRRVFELALYLTGVNLATDRNGESHCAPSIGQKQPAQPLYAALRQGEIRVLCMNTDEIKSIVGILKVVRLDDRHGFIKKLTNFQYGYEALSYVWGDETEKRIITIDGHKVEIHVSLYDALMVLREKRPGVPLWADALCINQADDSEKLHQIALMGKIYGAARKVWAFLGQGPAGMDEAMPFLPQLCKRAREIESPQLSTIKRGASGKSWQAKNIPGMGVRQLAELPAPGSPFWESIYQLVYNEYFNRLWILQEAAFAAKVEFLCGSYQISWDQMKLLFGIGVQQIAGFLAPPTFPPESRNGSVFTMREILKNEGLGLFPHLYLSLVEMCYPSMVAFFERNLDENDPYLKAILQPLFEMVTLMQSMNFERMLDLAVAQDCSQARDRIFAIMGLLEAKSPGAKLPWSKGQSVCELYVEAFYYLVRRDSSLQLLSMAPAESPNDLSLPSWCPTFHRQRGRQSGSTQRINTTNKDWQVSRRKQVISRGSNPLKLRLNGIQVDRIQTIPGTWTAVRMGDQKQTSMQRQAVVEANLRWLTLCLDAALRDLEPSSLSYHDRLDRLWQTMSLENMFIIGDNDLDLNDFVALLQFLGRAVSPDSSFVEESATWNKTHREKRLIILLDTYITNKVFFVADSDLFGMTYRGARDGDTICVLQGSRLPHLLRRQDADTWNFVGEAYVSGIMRGEAEKLVNGTLLETETFVLV